jgi:hypothetical protein
MNVTRLTLYHDVHARWNRMFPSQQTIALRDSKINTFSGDAIPPHGTDTVVKWTNGTTIIYRNLALVKSGSHSFSGITDGASFFRRFCNKSASSLSFSEEDSLSQIGNDITWRQASAGTGTRSSQSMRSSVTSFSSRTSLSSQTSRSSQRSQNPSLSRASRTPRFSPEATHHLYPRSEVIASDRTIGGYYLSAAGYEDAAVLVVPTFAPDIDDIEYESVVTKFLASAVAAGKTRLLIDLRSNGGGSPGLAIDLFKQLFPDRAMSIRMNVREHPLFNDLFEIYNKLYAGQTREDTQASGWVWDQAWNWKSNPNMDGGKFENASNYYGPYQASEGTTGANFTAMTIYNLSDPWSLSTEITGYRSRTGQGRNSRPFAAENITLLQDGACGSACHRFTTLMKDEGGVQQTVFGGLSSTGPMEGVAGTKGGLRTSVTHIKRVLDKIWEDMTAVSSPFSRQELDIYSATALGRFNSMTSLYTRVADGEDGSYAYLSFYALFRGKDDKQIPLEFIYEAADCRLFYTSSMIRNVTAVWYAGYDAQWRTRASCVEGSINHTSSLSSGCNSVTSNVTSTVCDNGAKMHFQLDVKFLVSFVGATLFMYALL